MDMLETIEGVAGTSRFAILKGEKEMFSSIRVGSDFPLKPKEVLRIKTSQGIIEITVSKAIEDQGFAKSFLCRSRMLTRSTNKPQISVLSDPKRKIPSDRSNPRRRIYLDKDEGQE